MLILLWYQKDFLDSNYISVLNVKLLCWNFCNALMWKKKINDPVTASLLRTLSENKPQSENSQVFHFVFLRPLFRSLSSELSPSERLGLTTGL